VLALSQLGAPFVANAVAGNFLQAGATNEALITPAGYAFSIWGIITVLCTLTAAAIVLNGLNSWWETAVLVDACVVFIGFSVWLVVAARGWLWVSVAVFAAMLSALIAIMRPLVRRRHDLRCRPWLPTLATATFGLYAGWSSVAVFANVAAALITSGAPASTAWWQFVLLVSAALVTIWLTTMLRGTPGFVAGALWALAAIAAGAAERDSRLLSVTATVAAVVVFGVAVVAFRRAGTRQRLLRKYFL
jgi:hypothetical protein